MEKHKKMDMLRFGKALVCISLRSLFCNFGISDGITVPVRFQQLKINFCGIWTKSIVQSTYSAISMRSFFCNLEISNESAPLDRFQ